MSRHMHFHREIDQLKKMILQLGVLVEDRLRRACTILETKDEAQAQAIMTSDWEIDDMEIRVEEECLKILALHQPVARDLRLIVSIIKINSELSGSPISRSISPNGSSPSTNAKPLILSLSSIIRPWLPRPWKW